MGCVEPQKSGRIYQWTSTGYTQWPIAIEFVLNRGRMVLFDSYQGLETPAIYVIYVLMRISIARLRASRTYYSFISNWYGYQPARSP